VATTQATIAAERWLDEVILSATLPADVAGGALAESVSLPSGIGDVAIMSVHLRARTVDVGPATASSVPRGARAFIVSPDLSTLLDVVGSAEWQLVRDTATDLEYWCTLDPDALCLWRQNELLNLASPELDSDATPTGDVICVIKAVRVRPLETPATPLQLVR